MASHCRPLYQGLLFMTVRDGPVESGPVAYIVVYIWCRRSSSQPSHGTAQKNLTDAFSPGVLTPLQRSLRDVHLGATNARTEPRYRFGRPARRSTAIVRFSDLSLKGPETLQPGLTSHNRLGEACWSWPCPSSTVSSDASSRPLVSTG